MNRSISVSVSRKKPSDTRRQRDYDFLYDPVHTVSSEVDHVRSRAPIPVRRVVRFDSMFSSLPHHPAHTLQLSAADPVPPSMDQRWRGTREQPTQTQLQQHSGYNPRRQDEPHGADQWKYYKRPLLPSTQPLLSNSVYASSQENSVKPGDDADRPTHATVGVQTDYRESETQTDPYSSDYVIRPGATPSDMLLLAPLTLGHGLPAGLAEVEMIERARAKRVWEASLPPLDDLSQLDKRSRMMEEKEAEEWAFREAVIQNLQDSRHAVLMALLQRRDETQTDVTNQRLSQVFSKLQKERRRKLHQTQSDYSRALRKLELKGRDLKGQLQRLGFDNSQFFPHIGKGVFTSAHDHESKNLHLNSFEVLQELEAELSTSLRKSLGRRSDVVRPSVNQTFEMMEAYKALREEIRNTKQPKMCDLLVKKKKPVPRPATPRVEEPPEGEEEMELAVIHLQKLLRGRSIQHQLFQSKENYADLIQELRSTQALQQEEQELQEADKEHITALKEQRDTQIHQAADTETSRARALGGFLESMFDTLSKELIRHQEERRIHAFMLGAQRVRRIREATESGRRQTVERRRLDGKEKFRQMVVIHQESVDLYLDDVIAEAVETVVDAQAREEISRKAKEVNDIAYAMEERDRLQSEEVVSELVYTFLLPEAEKMNRRRKAEKEHQMYMEVARRIINDAADNCRRGFTSAPETASVVETSSGEQQQEQQKEEEQQDHKEEQQKEEEEQQQQEVQEQEGQQEEEQEGQQQEQEGQQEGGEQEEQEGQQEEQQQEGQQEEQQQEGQQEEAQQQQQQQEAECLPGLTEETQHK